MKRLSISVELTDIYTNDTCRIHLPQKKLAEALPEGWDGDQLQKSILGTNYFGDPGFEGDEKTDLIKLNSLLLGYAMLDAEDKDLIYNLFDAEEEKDLVHLQSIFNTYDGYEVVPDAPWEEIREILADNVLRAIFDVDIATQIIEFHQEFLPKEVQTTLILVGLRSKVILHHNDTWYVKFPSLVETLQNDDDTLLFG